MGMGEAGFESAAQDNGLKVAIKLPGQRSGRVWAIFPGSRVAVKDVEFAGEWEGTIEAGMILCGNLPRII